MRSDRYIRQWISTGINEQDAKTLSQEIKSNWQKHIDECEVCTLDYDCPAMMDLIAQFSAINAYRTRLYIARTAPAPQPNATDQEGEP